MAFVFRLERVLSVRCIQEEAARQRHAAAQHAAQAAAASLQELNGKLRTGLEELDQRKRRDELSGDALYLHSLYLTGLRRHIDGARVRLAEAEETLERTGTELLAAHQAREALERLREREESAWRRAQAKREADDLDEIAVMRHRTREEEEHGS